MNNHSIQYTRRLRISAVMSLLSTSLFLPAAWGDDNVSVQQRATRQTTVGNGGVLNIGGGATFPNGAGDTFTVESGGTVNLTGASTLQNNGTMVFQQGAIINLCATCTLENNGTLTAADFSLGGNFSNSGTFNHSGLVTFDGTSTVESLVDTTFDSVLIEFGASVTLLNTGGAAGYTGDLTNNGSLSGSFVLRAAAMPIGDAAPFLLACMLIVAAILRIRDSMTGPDSSP